MVGHIMPTVAQITAVSNITGLVARTSNTRLASLNEQGLPSTSSRPKARLNSTATTAQMGIGAPSMYTPPLRRMASSTPRAPVTLMSVAPLTTYRL